VSSRPRGYAQIRVRTWSSGLYSSRSWYTFRKRFTDWVYLKPRALGSRVSRLGWCPPTVPGHMAHGHAEGCTMLHLLYVRRDRGTLITVHAPTLLLGPCTSDGAASSACAPPLAGRRHGAVDEWGRLSMHEGRLAAARHRPAGSPSLLRADATGPLPTRTSVRTTRIEKSISSAMKPRPVAARMRSSRNT